MPDTMPVNPLRIGPNFLLIGSNSSILTDKTSPIRTVIDVRRTMGSSIIQSLRVSMGGSVPIITGQGGSVT